MGATDIKIEIEKKIQQRIQGFSEGNLTANALQLFQTLGYNTERQAPLDRPTYNTFKESWIDVQSKFSEKNALVEEWKYVDLLFQLSKEEVLKQTSLFDTKRVDNAAIESYLFFTIELIKPHYSRTELSRITREVNSPSMFKMPIMILFKHGSSLTLSIINRRLHKRDESRDVLEKVTLIKDIQIQNPHRAHIDILFDLSFDELKDKYSFTNFVELHNAWQKTLDTKELNKRFFQELADWYFYAQGHVKFPIDEKIKEKRNVQINLIRLITRLIFVWFLKEKNLIEDNLFNKIFLKKILKGFDPDSEKTRNYYPAILQNLFFATLNQKMGEREFVKDEDSFYKKDHGVKTLYRYAEMFNISESEVMELFNKIPFLNGGLFDCLDKDNEGTSKHEFIDGFTRKTEKRAIVPDFLFFGEKRIVDLTASYGYKKNKETFRGLIKIFESYKFTIEENTPIEEEIALDPELLGKVFENLLAYYNPETETTAQNQTGSFYTPREIVNYMVDESLIAYLKTQLTSTNPSYIEFGKVQTQLFGNEIGKGQLSFTESINESRWTGKEDQLEQVLRHLIHYNDEPHPFNEQEIQQLIFAIDHCKILDPACGSGAFPMGMLHKLVYVLGKLDRDNIRWRELQKLKAIRDTEQAFNIGDVKQREDRLKEINEIFENNASDFGRKLYLIENCIYGVDIQAIAVQISKLRFFISLVVDQQERRGAENRGLRPLPNLETKFVAANTLIGLDKPAQLPMGYEIIYPLQEELQKTRHKHFEAKNRKDKLKYQKEDKNIRRQIADKLKELGFGNNDAEKVARFDLYDQNTAAGWFEPEWMFGKDLAKGFDIVIGNPPYIDSETMVNIGLEYLRTYLSNKLKFTKGNWDIYIAFFEVGFNLLNKEGVLSYISPDKWISKPFGYELRKGLLNNIYLIAESGRNVFESVNVDSIITFIINKRVLTVDIFKFLEEAPLKLTSVSKTTIKDPFAFDWLFSSHIKLLRKLEFLPNKLKEYGECESACATSDAYKLKDYIVDVSRERYDPENYLKVINTGTIGKYISKWGVSPMTYLKDKYLCPVVNKKNFIKNFSNSYGQKSLKPKIIIKGLTLLDVCIDNSGEVIPGKTTLIITKDPGDENELKFLLAILNCKLPIFFIKEKYRGSSYNQGINFSTDMINEIPLPLIGLKTKNIIEGIVDFILQLKVHSKDTVFFERLIDAMVYELYLEEEVKTAGCEVLKYLTDLPELKEGWSDEKKLQTIEKVFNELSNPSHPVSVAMFKMDTIEEIRIIEGKQ